jgi:hypothetical protein
MFERIFLTYAPTNAASCKGCGGAFYKGDTKVGRAVHQTVFLGTVPLDHRVFIVDPRDV